MSGASKDYGPTAKGVRAEGSNAYADIDAALGAPKTPEDLIEDARWWLRELGDALPEASPLFKALVRVVRELDKDRAEGAGVVATGYERRPLDDGGAVLMTHPRPLYICPDGHRWEDHSGAEAPLVNIKCPHCGKTAMRHHRARAVNRWNVQPLRTLTLDTRDFERGGPDPSKYGSSSHAEPESAERSPDPRRSP